MASWVEVARSRDNKQSPHRWPKMGHSPNQAGPERTFRFPLSAAGATLFIALAAPAEPCDGNMASSTGRRRAATALSGGHGDAAVSPLPRSWPRFSRFHTRPALVHHVTAPAPFRWARPRSCPRSPFCPVWEYGRACRLASSLSRFLMSSWLMPAFFTSQSSPWLKFRCP